MEKVTINEVGLRDGIQAQPKFVATEQKIAILADAIGAGLRHFEVTSFVSPKAVPQMADAAELCRRLPPLAEGEYTALVPNLRGYERAAESGVKSVAVVLCTTETMNRRNTNMSLAEAIASGEAVVRRGRADRTRVRAYIATASACPFEGKVDPAVVQVLAERMLAAGADEIAVADTIGAANPAQMADLLGRLIRAFGADRLAVHFHDTRGMGLALAWTAAQLGIRRFDSSIGGLGGCPFAPGASGNLATEDLVFMLGEAGYDTGVDMDALAVAVNRLERVFERPVGGRIMRWYNSQRRLS